MLSMFLAPETKEAAITFFVDPRNRVYVRRINFNGADNVNDEVFRREMRQLEGGYLSNALVDRSKLSLQQLPYVESVEHETTPVPGSPDLVDVDFEIEEGLPGQFGGSLGYSETYGITLGGNFIHSNFMGTGRRVAMELRGGEYQKIYDINFTDPYRNLSTGDWLSFIRNNDRYSREALEGDLEKLRAEGFLVLACVAQQDATPLGAFGTTLPLPPRVVLLFGTEGAGLEPATRAAADARITVPTAADVDSLNVATASGIVLHHFSRVVRP